MKSKSLLRVIRALPQPQLTSSSQPTDVFRTDRTTVGGTPSGVFISTPAFCCRLKTLSRGADQGLRAINRDLIAALGLLRGVAHAEFIQAYADGKCYFLECAARVGGAYINEMVEAASGINLWREWARIEIAGGDGSYKLPPVRQQYAGVILSLARQDNPDTSAYNDPEVCLRIKRHHHAGLVLRSADPQRIPALLENYARRFAEEFLAIEPPRDKPAA